MFVSAGSNQNFVQLAEVATGIDGTTGDGKYSWTCPEVTINAPIYFYGQSARAPLRASRAEATRSMNSL